MVSQNLRCLFFIYTPVSNLQPTTRINKLLLTRSFNSTNLVASYMNDGTSA